MIMRRTAQDIKTAFEAASENENEVEIAEIAKVIAEAAMEGVHAGSPMYREFKDALKDGFAKAVDLECAKYENGDSFDELTEDQQKIVDRIKEEAGTAPGYIFFGYPEDIKEFDDLWAAQDYTAVLAALAADEDLMIETLDDLEQFLSN